MKKDEWRLESIRIDFERGYDFKEDPEERVDRYEGTIEFKNGAKESFKFNVDPKMCDRYIELISNDIVKAADGLAMRLKKSLGLD